MITNEGRAGTYCVSECYGRVMAEMGSWREMGFKATHGLQSRLDQGEDYGNRAGSDYRRRGPGA